MVRVAFLAALAGLVCGEWHPMPNGLYYHESCIHRFDEEFHVDRSAEGGSVVTFASQQERMELSPCEHVPRLSPEGPALNGTQLAEGASYYSAWSVYAKAARAEGFGYMSSKWTVPAKPTGRGPADQSSVYLFNGLEDGGGHTGAASLILQPVLQFGKSGCIVNPLKWGQWHFTSYLVDGAGHAYCGSRLGPLDEGEEVVGVMTLVGADDNTWRVDSTRTKTGEISTHSVSLGDTVIDAAYATMEGMVIYSCNAYPSSGSCTFEENVLKDRAGNVVTPKW